MNLKAPSTNTESGSDGGRHGGARALHIVEEAQREPVDWGLNCAAGSPQRRIHAVIFTNAR